jgi:hypothetical protein
MINLKVTLIFITYFLMNLFELVNFYLIRYFLLMMQILTWACLRFINLLDCWTWIIKFNGKRLKFWLVIRNLRGFLIIRLCLGNSLILVNTLGLKKSIWSLNHLYQRMKIILDMYLNLQEIWIKEYLLLFP